MWISPGYRKEYETWIAKGMFAELYSRESEHFFAGLAERNAIAVAGNLDCHATCFYTRGMVALIAGDERGWADVQCGYWAALYSLLFGVVGYHGTMHGERAELVLLLGLARLFRQDGDALRLSELVDKHFSLDETIGDRIPSGRKILQSILEPETRFTYDELLEDRKECCQKRDAWPTRPTEIRPFGVLDVEMILRFPSQAAFKYAGDFVPTNDDRITQAIVAYHSWYEAAKKS